MKLIFDMIFLFLVGCEELQPIANADHSFERVVEAHSYSKEQILNGPKIGPHY